MPQGGGAGRLERAGGREGLHWLAQQCGSERIAARSWGRRVSGRRGDAQGPRRSAHASPAPAAPSRSRDRPRPASTALDRPRPASTAQRSATDRPSHPALASGPRIRPSRPALFAPLGGRAHHLAVFSVGPPSERSERPAAQRRCVAESSGARGGPNSPCRSLARCLGSRRAARTRRRHGPRWSRRGPAQSGHSRWRRSAHFRGGSGGCCRGAGRRARR